MPLLRSWRTLGWKSKVFVVAFVPSWVVFVISTPGVLRSIDQQIPRPSEYRHQLDTVLDFTDSGTGQVLSLIGAIVPAFAVSLIVVAVSWIAVKVSCQIVQVSRKRGDGPGTRVRPDISHTNDGEALREPSFIVRGLDRNGNSVKLKIEASSKVGARKRAEARCAVVNSVQPVTANTAAGTIESAELPWLDRHFANTRPLFLILASVFLLPFLLAVVAVFRCKDTRAWENAMIVVITGVIVIAVGVFLNL